MWFDGPFSITFKNAYSHRDMLLERLSTEEQNNTKPVRAIINWVLWAALQDQAIQFLDLPRALYFINWIFRLALAQEK